MGSKMNGKDIHEHTLNTILSLGLAPEVSAGMETAARMENVSIQAEAWEGYTSVAAIVLRQPYGDVYEHKKGDDGAMRRKRK